MPFDLATAKPVGGSRFDLSTARPVEDAEPAAPPVTAMQRVNAAASGVNSGVADVLGIPVDTMQNIIDLGKALSGFVYHETTGNPIPDSLQLKSRENVWGSGENLRALSDKLPGQPLRNPRPDDTASRYLHAGGRALAPAVVGARIAPQAVNAPAAGMQLPTHVAANVAGSEAAQLAAENDVGPVGQLLAGTAAGGLVSAARPMLAEGTKRSFRGGEEGRQRTAQNIQDFENAGATPSAGAATQSRRVQATESLLAKTPGAAGRMTAQGEKLAQDLGNMVEKMAGALAPKASGEQAGRAITRAVSGEDGFVQQFKKKQSKLYDELDQHIAKDARVDVSRTAAALEKLNADIPGAPNISEFFKNAKIRGIEGALKADTEGASALSARTDIPEFAGAKPQKPTQQRPSDPFRQTPNRDPFGPTTKDDLDLAASLLNDKKLPYEAVKKLRTLVGNEMADAGLLSDVPRSKWKALYSALSSDMENAAAAAGKDASAAFTRANKYTAAGMKRIEVLDSVLEKNGGPEAVFRAATSGAKEGATTLRAVMQSLPPEAQKTLSASVLRRLGRATAGRQDDLGETFSTETFLTNWNTLSPQAKAVLFDRFGAGFRADMDTVAKVAANLRSGSKVFQNPSGTGQSVAQATTAATAALSLLTGNVGTAAAIGAGVGGANLSARLLTNPRFVKWLATTTKAPAKALPSLIVQLEQGTDDEREFARLVKESRRSAR